jgi:hypothetical protein
MGSASLLYSADTRVSTGHGRDRVPELRLANLLAIQKHASRCLQSGMSGEPGEMHLVYLKHAQIESA